MENSMKKSFTLIELLVVIAIIGVLAALVIPNLTQARAKARDAKRTEDLRALQNALELYYSDHNSYPSGEIGSNSQDGFCLERSLNEDGSCPSEKPDQFCNLIKPYLARLPKDPQFRWSDPSSPCYYYITDDTGQAYKAAAKMEKDSQRAENDGGTNSQWFEISDTGFKGLTTLSFNPPGGLPGNWWDANWTYRKKITINHTKIDSDLTDFPVLVKLTSANFDFSKANADGFDIRFTSDDGTTLLKFERERHDQANSLAEYWVKIPAVSASADTIFYVYYRTEDTADGADPTNVWDANYKGVWHKKDITTSTINDSTVNANNGTKKAANEPIEADGKIGKAQDYDGTDDYISLGSGSSLNITGTALTLETWVNLDVIEDEAIICKANSVGEAPYKQYSLEISNSKLWFGADYDGTFAANNDTTAITTGWKYVVVTYDGSNVRFYIDGALSTSSSRTGNIGSHSTWELLFSGVNYSKTYGIDGKMDETRISSITRSAAWIKASYNSGNDSLLIYGSEEQN